LLDILTLVIVSIRAVLFDTFGGSLFITFVFAITVLFGLTVPLAILDITVTIHVVVSVSVAVAATIATVTVTTVVIALAAVVLARRVISAGATRW